MHIYQFKFKPNDKVINKDIERIMLVIAVNIEEKGAMYYCRDLNGRNMKKEVEYMEKNYELFSFN